MNEKRQKARAQVIANKPKGNSYYGKVAKIYQTRREKQPWWDIEQSITKSFLEQLPKGLKVLDVLFGTGRFVPFYIERDYDIHGLDASDEIVTVGAKILGNDFKTCTIRRGFSTDLPYDDGEFDLLVSTRFLRDIISSKNVKRTMEEFSRVTSKYAILQLGVDMNSDNNGDNTPKDDERMGSNFPMNDLEAFLKSYGFQITDKKLVEGAGKEGADVYLFLCNKK